MISIANNRRCVRAVRLMAPKMAATLKEAKGRYGIQDQRQAGTNAAAQTQTFQVQEIERLSASKNKRRTTSRNTGKTPPANRTPPGIDLEKSKAAAKQAARGAMPPRPPRPPREGGKKGRAKQTAEAIKLRRAWDQGRQRAESALAL